MKFKASDLHLKVGKPPMVRVDGTLRPMNRGPIEDEEMVRLCFPLMNERNRKIFERDGGADFAHTLDVDGTIWRFRVNLLQQLGHVGLVARRVNSWIPDFEGLNLPPSIEQLCTYDQGMVLLAGVTGSGKSTTIASMLNWINKRYRKHILTLEDPIEFVFTEDKCLINQREIGLDVVDFEIGMKHAVREDPDVMLVGEMRDKETFMTAIHAAETGHLVFGTIHASSASTTIGRILDLFPAGHALGPAQRDRVQHAGHHRPEAAQEHQAGRRPRADRRDHDLQRQRARKPILEENDDKLPDIIRIGKLDGHAGLHDEPQEAGGRRVDRPRGGDGSGAEPRGAEDGAQGHRSERSGDYLMRHAGLVFLGMLLLGERRSAAAAVACLGAGSAPPLPPNAGGRCRRGGGRRRRRSRRQRPQLRRRSSTSGTTRIRFRAVAVPSVNWLKLLAHLAAVPDLGQIRRLDQSRQPDL